MVLRLKPRRGGFLRLFGLGWFIKEFLSGHAPYGSSAINPSTGAPQADIFKNYKEALIRETAKDRAVRAEERRAKRTKKGISHDRIDDLTKIYLARLPYKAQGCRYHSFVVYFSMLQKLKWVELTGRKEPSEFQDNYPEGQPRKYFRLTAAGKASPEFAWANPHRALYG